MGSIRNHFCLCMPIFTIASRISEKKLALHYRLQCHHIMFDNAMPEN